DELADGVARLSGPEERAFAERGRLRRVPGDGDEPAHRLLAPELGEREESALLEPRVVELAVEFAEERGVLARTLLAEPEDCPFAESVGRRCPGCKFAERPLGSGAGVLRECEEREFREFG